MTLTPTPPLAALEPFRSACQHAGFDLVHPFRLDAYNRSAPRPLPDFGRRAALGLLVGNTRSLWDAFSRALQAQPERLEDEHPLDRYAMDHITKAAETLRAAHAILWAHTPPPDAIPVQRIAQAAGCAWLSPSHLSVHPVFGPWLALRAVIVVDEESGLGEPLAPRDPCTACAKPCLGELARAVAASRSLDQAAVGEHFELWRRVRDVCPEGTAHRYGEDQLRYHYTKERGLLAK